MKKENNNKLFNYNEYDKEIKKKTKKKTKKSKKNINSNKNLNENSNNSIFDFSNEIVIGLERIEDKHEEIRKPKSKLNSKKKKQKNSKKEIKNKEEKNKTNRLNKKEKKLSKKSVKNDKSTKNKTQTLMENYTSSEQDIIFNTKIKTKKKDNKTKNKVANKINIKILKIVSLVILFIVAIILMMMSPLFEIKEINVAGNKKISTEEIISMSSISINENTYRTSLKKAKIEIKKNPYIENVNIKRVLPRKILIEVEEREPTFMIEFGGGYSYINNQGYILEISDNKLELPILQGAETIIENTKPGDRLQVNDLEKLSTVIKIMKEAEKNNEEEIDAASLITRIDIENKQNYKIIFESEQKVANLGDATKLDSKMAWIKKILKKEEGIGGEIFFNITQNNDTPVFRQNV